MTVLLPSPRPRLAFLAAPRLAPHVPSTADWADTHFVPMPPGGEQAAVDAAARLEVDVTLVLEPQRLSPAQVARLPGVRVGLVVSPVAAPEALVRLARPGAGGLHWLTYFEQRVPAALAGLPLLRTLPLPVDTARFADGPRLDRWRVVAPAWALPPKPLLASLHERTPLELLPAGGDVATTLERLDDAGVLLYASEGPAGRLDPLPLLALARGLLVVSTSPFPEDWYIEEDDEFLHRRPEELLVTLDEVLRLPMSYRGVRVRAWQKAREAFDASATVRRLLHDLSLFGGVAGHLARLEAAPATSVPGEALVAGPARRARS